MLEMSLKFNVEWFDCCVDGNFFGSIIFDNAELNTNISVQSEALGGLFSLEVFEGSWNNMNINWFMLSISNWDLREEKTNSGSIHLKRMSSWDHSVVDPLSVFADVLGSENSWG